MPYHGLQIQLTIVGRVPTTLTFLVYLHMPKGKIMLSRVIPSAIRKYEGLLLARPGGLVRIDKVWTAKISWHFLEDPATIIESSKNEGFYVLVAYMPEIEDELDRFMPIKQANVEYSSRFLVKHSQGVWETDFHIQLAKAKNIFINVDKTFEEEPLAYVAPRKILPV